MLSDEDQELAQTLNSDQAFQDLSGAQNIKVSISTSQVKKEQLLKNTDPVLLDLGSVQNADGTFSRASFESFQGKVFELGAAQTRAPSSMNIIVKVILSLLLVAAGLAILVFVLAVFALAMGFAGSITPMGWIVLSLLTVGSLAGMFFGLKAIINAEQRSHSKEQLAIA